MFRWLNKQGVRSDRGFEVQCTGRFSIEYREGPKKISVYVEPGYGGGKSCVMIMERNAFERWDGDPPDAIIPPDKQKQMLKNFVEALEFQGLAVEV